MPALASPLQKTQLGRKLGSLFRRKVSSHFKHDEALLSQLLKNVHGKVLLIGENLPLVLQQLHFPTISHVVIIEPNASHHNRLREVAKASKIPVAILGSRVETMDFKDASFDSIVVTHALRSVSNPEEVLKKGYRWLAPGGTFHFLAHLEPVVPNKRSSSSQGKASSLPLPAAAAKTDMLRVLESFPWDKGSEFAIFYRRHSQQEEPVQHLMGTARKLAF